MPGGTAVRNRCLRRHAVARVLVGVVLAGLALGFAASPATVEAAAPLVHTQAPGWYRFMLGAFEVTALGDGTLDQVPEKLLKAPPAKTTKALAQSWLASPVETAVNAYLVNTGARLVLIDAGGGALAGPTLGRLAHNLRAAGYLPEQVDDVFLTHMHPDHVGGLVAAGAMVFPHATVHADKREADYWLNEATLAKASGDTKTSVQGAMAALKPYIAAGRFQTFVADAEIVPGVRSRATYGHTAGHTSYVVQSREQRLLVLGDLVHVGAVQFADPSVSISFDADPKAAAAIRAEVFKHAAKEDDLVAGAHLPFPGVGHVRSIFRGYEWVPVPWTRLP
jgi:glyoxylase-like metal-dependent hydrolase (beta-lactamase superfamily II)